jgi:hypothetical protein
MPRYHCLDTEVQLCTWNPLLCQSAFLDSSNPATRISTRVSHSTSSSSSGIQKDASTFNGEIPPYDRSRSCKVEKLTEEYFKGREGLDFLGCDAPFFLIHAGNDPSDDTHSAEPWIGTNNSLYQDHRVSLESSERLTGSPFPRRKSTLAKAVPDIPYIDSTVNEGGQFQNDSHEVYLSSDGSSLSSLSSTAFLSPHATALRSEEPMVEIEGQTFGESSQIHASHSLTEPTASGVTPKAPNRTPGNLVSPFRAPKSESVPKPIQVVVKLSEKSFISPIIGAETNHYDICINFFYNGEFNASKVIEYSAWAADESKSYSSFSGRRIETCQELPWMITAKSEDCLSSTSLIGKSATALTPPERWNKLTEMLLLEANEWGREERGYRCPTREYLELLSTKTMPVELNSPLVSTGSGFGRVSQLNAAKEISSPHRNLPENHFQNSYTPVGVQVGSRIATQSLVTAIDFSMESTKPPRGSSLNSFVMEMDHNDTRRSSSTIETSHAVTTSSYQWDQISSSELEVATPTTDVKLHSAGSQAVMRATSITARIPAALAIAPTPRPPHPHRPENVPQKRYRGSEPILPPSPPPKRQKTVNLFEELPFDLNTAAYMSTRARRSASTPFTQATPKSQPEIAIKRKRSVNQVKNAFSNAESTETPTAGTPLTPKRDKIDDPKTPESGGPLKKKPRSNNYNPKLSNRPQNLRRKNSAGEWIIPPCRKNSSGEWETPTKAGRAKVASFLGGHTEGATLGESEKIFQPVFIISADNGSRNMAIGPTIPDGTSLEKDKVILKEDTHSSNAGEKANEAVITTAAIEIENENTPPGHPAEQTKEVSITDMAPKITNSIPKVAFRHVRGTQNRELLATSSTEVGAADFDNYFQRKKTGVMVTSSKNKPRKKTLRIRFFQGTIGSDGEIVGDGYGKRRWLVRRCITPEYTPAPSSGKKPTSYPFFENPKLKISAFATGPQGDKVTNVVTDSALRATSRSRRNPGKSQKADTGIAKNSVIATLRDNRVVIPQQHQILDITQPRPRFVVPDHNSRVLKFVSRHPAATETDAIKLEAQGACGEPVRYNFVDEKVGRDAGGSSAFATHDGPQNIPRQDTGLKASSTPQSVNEERIVLSYGCAAILGKGKPSSPSIDSEVQNEQVKQASAQIAAASTAPKRPFRPRAVGSTELKALLESHDRHNVANTSLGAPLGMMHSQLMTRASRKIISFKQSKAIGPKGDVTDTQISSDKPTAHSAPKKRSSSGKFIEKTAVTPIVQRYRKDTVEDLSKVVDAQTGGKASSGASSYEVKEPLLRNQKSNTPEPNIIATMAYDLSLLGAGELLPSDNPTTQKIKKVVSRRLKGLETPAGTIVGFEKETIKSIGRVATPIANLSGASILASQSQKDKEEALHADVENAMEFEDAAHEVDVALKQVCKARTEINKAAGDLENLVTHSSAPQKSQYAAAVYTAATNAKTGVRSVMDIHKSRGQNTPTPSALAYGVIPWKPGCLCDDSILTYAKDENWDGLARNPVTGQMCRRVGTQEESYFRAFSVLMGVRYVVVGSAVVK